jgi:hypothetical protein
LDTPFEITQTSMVEFSASAVPEPGTWVLMLGGAAILALRTRRYRG